jgi:hypothetical protein
MPVVANRRQWLIGPAHTSQGSTRLVSTRDGDDGFSAVVLGVLVHRRTCDVWLVGGHKR